MSSCSGGRIEWDLWKLDQEGRVRLARHAWMFKMPKPERPGRLEFLRRRVGEPAITLGERLIRRASPAAAGHRKAPRSIAT
jgi:hypothetical protein